MNNDLDPLVRSARAVCISTSFLSGGKLRLFFDRVQREGEGKERRWAHSSFVTHITIDESKLRTPNFDQEELANFAHTVLGMLSVLAFGPGSDASEHRD